MGSGVGGSDTMVVIAARALDVPFTAMGTMTTPVAMVT
jgi:hypothetical protein